MIYIQVEFCSQNIRNELDTNLHNEQRIYSVLLEKFTDSYYHLTRINRRILRGQQC